MAVAFDAVSASVYTTNANYSWTHTPSGTPRAVVVFAFSQQGTPDDTGATYGGTAMGLMSYYAADTDTEVGTIRAYFLDNVASGAQTVQVNGVSTTINKKGVAITVTALGASEIHEPGVITQGGSSQNTAATTSGTGTGASNQQNVDDGSPGTNSLRMAGGYWGSATPPAAGADSTSQHNADATAWGTHFVTETTVGQGSRPVGFATGTTDDRAVVFLAVREVPAAGFDPALFAGTWIEPVDHQIAE